LEILTGILVIITAFYAWATYRILKANEKTVNAMRDQEEALRRPYITIAPYTVPGTPLMGICIANTGKSPAQNLSLSLDKNFYRFGEKDKNITQLNAFREPIDMFAPGTELNFDLAMGFNIFAEDADPNIMPRLFSITASYEFFGKRVTEKNTIDLNPFLGSTLPRDSLVKELKNGGMHFTPVYTKCCV
jgi:hypothetical protein